MPVIRIWPLWVMTMPGTRGMRTVGLRIRGIRVACSRRQPRTSKPFELGLRLDELKGAVRHLVNRSADFQSTRH